jgi:hypothetical protein
VGGATIVEPGGAFHAEFDTAADDLDAAYQVVVMAKVLDRHEIGDLGHAFASQETGEQNVRVGEIGLFMLTGSMTRILLEKTSCRTSIPRSARINLREPSTVSFWYIGLGLPEKSA